MYALLGIAHVGCRSPEHGSVSAAPMVPSSVTTVRLGVVVEGEALHTSCEMCKPWLCGEVSTLLDAW